MLNLTFKSRHPFKKEFWDNKGNRNKVYRITNAWVLASRFGQLYHDYVKKCSCLWDTKVCMILSVWSQGLRNLPASAFWFHFPQPLLYAQSSCTWSLGTLPNSNRAYTILQTRFLKLGPTDILDWIFLCCEGHPVYSMVLSSIPGLPLQQVPHVLRGSNNQTRLQIMSKLLARGGGENL